MAVLCYATNLYDVAIVNCFARWRNNYILLREFPLVRWLSGCFDITIAIIYIVRFTGAMFLRKVVNHLRQREFVLTYVNADFL